MPNRREAVKAIGAGALAASAGLLLGQPAAAAPRELRYAPEKGAQLRMLRWKRFVQGDEDQWLANTRKFTQQSGVPVQVESVNLEDIPSKASMAANVGAGPDIVMGSYGQPQLYPDACLDLTELANYLGDKYGGWYDAVKAYCMTDKRWIALGMGFPTSCVVYRESMVKAAGFSEIPRDLNGFLKLCRALHARGTPPGFALGNAIGDGTTWTHWLVWSHGGRLVDENNRLVINSKETIAALEYARELYPTFVPGTLSWLDPSNNKAFLAGQIGLTYNGISVYYAAKTSSDPDPESNRGRHAACAFPDRARRQADRAVAVRASVGVQVHALSERGARISALHARGRAIHGVAERFPGLLRTIVALARVRPDLVRRSQAHAISRGTGHDVAPRLRRQGRTLLRRSRGGFHHRQHGRRSGNR